MCVYMYMYEYIRIYGSVVSTFRIFDDSDMFVYCAGNMDRDLKSLLKIQEIASPNEICARRLKKL